MYGGKRRKRKTGLRGEREKEAKRRRAKRSKEKKRRREEGLRGQKRKRGKEKWLKVLKRKRAERRLFYCLPVSNRYGAQDSLLSAIVKTLIPFHFCVVNPSKTRSNNFLKKDKRF